MTDDEDQPTGERPLSDQLHALGEAVGAAKVHQRDVEVKQQQLAQEIADLSEQVVELHAQGDAVAVAKVSKTRARQEGVVARDLAERLAGARRATERAEVARQEFATAHIDELLREIKPDADEAAEMVQRAIEALSQAQRRWDQVQSDHASLLRLSGRSGEGLRPFPPVLVELVRRSRRAGQVDVPSPAIAR
jgi:chromosome segregation ATPase